jgi:hypothetical protein
MKTLEFIDRLVADAAAPAKPPEVAIAAGSGAGMLVTVVFFLAAISWRPDIAAAAETVRFVAKIVIMAVLAAGAIGCAVRLARPGVAVGGWPVVVMAAALLLASAVTVELAAVPRAEWWPRLFGDNWLSCLSLIVAMSVAPLAGTLYALKQAAPMRPGLTGAVAGLAAGSLAAVLYATHCTDDSPLFVATWYSLAIGMVSLVGSLIGHRVLRW